MTPEVYWRASLLSPRGTGGEGVGGAKFTHIGADRDIFTHIGHHIRTPQAEKNLGILLCFIWISMIFLYDLEVFSTPF